MEERDFPHLAHPVYKQAEQSWEHHFGTCVQCQMAPGPPPYDCPADDLHLYACPVGVRLHNAAVVAAHMAYDIARSQDPSYGR